MKKYFIVIAISLICGFVGAFVFNSIQPNRVVLQTSNASENDAPVISNVHYNKAMSSSDDMVKASQIATPCVVYIKTLSNQQQGNSADPFFDFWSNMDFFGRRGPDARSGSGVII